VAASLSIPPSHAVDVHAVQGDISQVETAQRIVEETLDRFGRIDTLVNNAGIFIGKPFLDYTYDEFGRDDCRESGWLLSPHAARRPQHGEQGRGHVVNITRASSITRASGSPSASRRLRREASML